MRDTVLGINWLKLVAHKWSKLMLSHIILLQYVVQFFTVISSNHTVRKYQVLNRIPSQARVKTKAM